MTIYYGNESTTGTHCECQCHALLGAGKMHPSEVQEICKLKLIFITLLLLSVATNGFSHSGRTDSRGGHYNRISGGYHYHHGMGPHQHPGGVCPYKWGGAVVVVVVFGSIIWIYWASKQPEKSGGAYTGQAIYPEPRRESKSKAPLCPSCGSEMILRTARKGRYAGKQFWGCRNYPSCREIINLNEKK